MSLTRFTIRQVEAFIAVADTHSFRVAADRLGLTSQAVSQLVAELENAVGFRVFDRTTRRVALSSAGKDFLPSALTMLRHVVSTDSAAADVRHRAAGLVRVGAPMVLASTALPEAIRSYQTVRPQVVIRIKDVPVDALVDSVEQGDVDLAVGPDRPVSDRVKRVALFDSPWVLWCSTSHPLARKKTIKWQDLGAYSLVAAGRDHEISVEQMKPNAPGEHHVTPVEIVDHISTALGMASQGLAATLAPLYVAAFARSIDLVSRRVVDPETVRKVCLYRSNARTASPAIEGFAEHLEQWLSRWPERMRSVGRGVR